MSRDLGCLPLSSLSPVTSWGQGHSLMMVFDFLFCGYDKKNFWINVIFYPDELIQCMYSGPSLNGSHLFPNVLSLKWICCCKESLNAAVWYVRKGLFYYILPRRKSVCVCVFFFVFFFCPMHTSCVVWPRPTNFLYSYSNFRCAMSLRRPLWFIY